MIELSREEITKENLEIICQTLKHNSQLTLISQAPIRERLANRKLSELIQLGLVNRYSHLQQGIQRIDYDDSSIIIEETPLQYPDSRLLIKVDAKKQPPTIVGPMTGMFAHVFHDDLYFMQVRGREIAAPGKIQIVAGHGRYRTQPSHEALNEIREELGTEGRLVFTEDRFLDVNPFMKGGRFPQLLFSYIAKADSRGYPIIKTMKELKDFRIKCGSQENREAYPFLVPVEKLREFLEIIDGNGEFYGPVKQTGNNFLNWYNKTFSKIF